MKVAVVGTGYVGLVTGTCLAEVGHDVTCMDRDQQKIDALLMGRLPIYEVGLEDMVLRNVGAGRLRFTANMVDALKEAEVVFLAVGTPQGEDGSADLRMIYAAAEQVGAIMSRSLTIVQKSTCPVGTATELERRVRAALAARGVDLDFQVVVNPEFLREGNAVYDFMNPDRVVIGARSEAAGRLVASLYAPIASADRIIMMDPASAELTKYASNGFLALKISFMNEIANLCEATGADVEAVRRGIGSDSRIGPAFLGAGIGYGGSCFPKDVQALIRTSLDFESPLQIMEAVSRVNQMQQRRQFEKIVRHFGGKLASKRIALWGLAFKPDTDDMREAPSIDLATWLLEAGAEVVAFDPIAMENAERVMPDGVVYASDAASCAKGSDALVLVTEWREFKEADLVQVAESMNTPVLFDFRNAFQVWQAIAAGFTYYAVGRAASAVPNMIPTL